MLDLDSVETASAHTADELGVSPDKDGWQESLSKEKQNKYFLVKSLSLQVFKEDMGFFQQLALRNINELKIPGLGMVS